MINTMPPDWHFCKAGYSYGNAGPIAMTIPMLFRNHFQLGYAVKSVDGALESLREKFGVRKWQVRQLPEASPIRALAWAYVKDMMIELVEVKPGHLPYYDDWIPESVSALRLHHLGYMVENEEEWQAVNKRFDDLGIQMAMDLELGNKLLSRYFDTVPLLGHYCEFVLLKPDGKTFWADVPHN